MTENSKYVRFDWAIKRILFGTAKNITDQISIGMDYKVIRKIYSVNILYFDFGSGDDYAYHGVTTFKGMTKKDAVLRFNNATDISAATALTVEQIEAL